MANDLIIRQSIHLAPCKINTKRVVLLHKGVHLITIFQFKEGVCFSVKIILTKEPNDLVELVVPLVWWQSVGIVVELLHIKWNRLLAVNRSHNEGPVRTRYGAHHAPLAYSWRSRPIKRIRRQIRNLQ